MSQRRRTKENQGERSIFNRRRGKTCERIVCDRPVSKKYAPYCSITCKRLAS